MASMGIRTHCLLLCALSALSACAAARGQLARDDGPAALAEGAPSASKPAALGAHGKALPGPLPDEMAAARVLRRHMLQLLPCDPGRAGSLAVLVGVLPSGAMHSLRAETQATDMKTVRCVLERVSWWSFPPLGRSSELRLEITFPLVPPSLFDHAAVLVPVKSGRIDLEGSAQVLLGLRERVGGCYRRRATEAQLVLLRVRLGEWGKLLDAALESDTGPDPREDRAAEARCLRKVLRRGEFPNPSGGEAELSYPYVLTR